MRTTLNLLATGISLTALGNGSGQPVIPTQNQTSAVGTIVTFWVEATGTESLECDEHSAGCL